MKKIFYFLLFILVSSCTGGESDDVEQFNVFIRNDSGKIFVIRVTIDNEVITNEEVLNGNSTLFCSYFALILLADIKEQHV